MTTQQIFDLAIKMGIKADLRGLEKVKKYLARLNKKYEAMSAAEKKDFDAEKLSNPFSDTRVLVDTERNAVKKILAGIDMKGSELLLADKLGIDLVIGPHPEGKALADLSGVMDLHAEVLAQYGVPINIAESVIRPRISEVSRGISPINHNRDVDLARMLKLDYMCVHTAADNLGASFMVGVLDKSQPETVGEVMEMLREIPEYREAIKYGAGPKILVGSPDSSCGRIAVTEFTGGTSGSKDMYEKMAQAGIGTIIGMHMSEDHRKEAEKSHVNVVIAGHMSSDSLGMNLFLDELEKREIEIIPCSGLIRVSRVKKARKSAVKKPT